MNSLVLTTSLPAETGVDTCAQSAVACQPTEKKYPPAFLSCPVTESVTLHLRTSQVAQPIAFQISTPHTEPGGPRSMRWSMSRLVALLGPVPRH